MTAAIFTALAGLFGALGVAGAAYAAHGEDVRLAGTAAAICLVHAPALMAAGLLAERYRWLAVPGALWSLGVLLFCGDLAVRLLGEDRLFPGAAPLGGSCLILGWLALCAVSLFGGVRRSVERR